MFSTKSDQWYLKKGIMEQLNIDGGTNRAVDTKESERPYLLVAVIVSCKQTMPFSTA